MEKSCGNCRHWQTGTLGGECSEHSANRVISDWGRCLLRDTFMDMDIFGRAEVRTERHSLCPGHERREPRNGAGTEAGAGFADVLAALDVLAAHFHGVDGSGDCRLPGTDSAACTRRADGLDAQEGWMLVARFPRTDGAGHSEPGNPAPDPVGDRP